MKKYLILGLVLFTMSCSSDDDEKDTPSQGLTQYEVDFILVKIDLDESMNKGYNPFSLDRKENGDNRLIGHGGLMVFGVKETDNIKFTSFDKYCPVEWNDKINGKIVWNNQTPRRFRCDVCKSEFDLATMQPISGKAKELGYKLVEYKIELDEEGENYHITNPNYKK